MARTAFHKGADKAETGKGRAGVQGAAVRRIPHLPIKPEGRGRRFAWSGRWFRIGSGLAAKEAPARECFLPLVLLTFLAARFLGARVVRGSAPLPGLARRKRNGAGRASLRALSQ
jgi:hypothetical protein